MTWDGMLYAIWDDTEQGWFCATQGRVLGRTYLTREAGAAAFASALQHSEGETLSLMEIDCRGSRPDVCIEQATSPLSAATKAAIARITVYCP